MAAAKRLALKTPNFKLLEGWCCERGLNSRPLPYQDYAGPETNSKSVDLTPTEPAPVLVSFTDNCAVSVHDNAKENPDALAGANGADVHSTVFTSELTPKLPEYATALLEAVTALPREDRLPLLELTVDHYRAGQPIPPLVGLMDEANFWADMATASELKAYLWACWSHMNRTDQAAFLGHIETQRTEA